jgi:glutamine synthetase
MNTFKFDSSLREHLSLTYIELKKFNIEIKKEQEENKPNEYFEKKILDFLKQEDRIKAVTVAFSDIEGKLQILDYDKKFFIHSKDNLTFDGSSIKGFTDLGNSDLRILPDFGSFRLLPSDIFGSGKALIFANVKNIDGSQFPSDFRGVLQETLKKIKNENDYTFLVAPEIEGFLLKGVDAEQDYLNNNGFETVTSGGYFNALPQDDLRKFIDTVAEVQRALGFENEKDHGEVAPSQFEINFKYTNALLTGDQILLYKLISRQVAKLMGFTASFLPKPVAEINGSGMHINMSIEKDNKNLFYKKSGEDNLSQFGQNFCTGILHRAKEMNAIYCPSINAYRRLDPNFEAPNSIQKSSKDRGSIIRIPLANEQTSRIELRPVSPDSNPYAVMFILLKSGLEGVKSTPEKLKEMREFRERKPIKKLYENFQESIAGFKTSKYMQKLLGEQTHNKYFELKKEVVDRSPKALGKKIKEGEVIFHHEITNQILWNNF